MLSGNVSSFISTNSPSRVYINIKELEDLSNKSGICFERRGDFAEVISWGDEVASPKRIDARLLDRLSRWFDNLVENPQPKLRYYDSKSHFFEYTLEVVWDAALRWDREGLEFITTKVIYAPRIAFNRGSSSFGNSHNGVQSVEGKLLEVLQLIPITIQFPEPAFSLPREPWREIYSAQGWEGGGIQDEVLVVFASEVSREVSPFISRLENLRTLAANI